VFSTTIAGLPDVMHDVSDACNRWSAAVFKNEMLLVNVRDEEYSKHPLLQCCWHPSSHVVVLRETIDRSTVTEEMTLSSKHFTSNVC
jgi:hypothetical protein